MSKTKAMNNLKEYWNNSSTMQKLFGEDYQGLNIVIPFIGILIIFSIVYIFN